MKAKEYLEQAYRVDHQIQSKLDQIQVLNNIATKATTTFGDIPHSSSPNPHKMEDIILRIVALESEIQDDLEYLIELKEKATHMIKKVKNVEHRTLLEERYLNFKTWEQIAEDLQYSVRQVYRMHGEAILECEKLQFKSGSEYATM